MKLFRLPVLLLVLALTGQALAAESVPQSRQQVTLTFAPVVRRAAPAVVNIYTRRVVKTLSPMFADPFFRQFFGEQMGIPRERVERSLGSGVIVQPNGVIVTNNHVIKDSDAITVVLADRREFAARVVGTDERTDLAVLKIDVGAEKLPVLPLADSDALNVGDIVLAIGDPFGVGQTVTMGIVSALARTAVGASDYRFFIQTDAAINPGNSGGALVDVEGRVVGINSAIYSQSGGSIGIGFAIPSNMVRAVLGSILSGGKAVRPWLGAHGQAVTPEMFRALGLSRPQGVLVNGVYPDSPAERAGLKVGDVVVAVQGHEVDDPEGLRFRIATLTPDANISLDVMRGGRPLSLTAHLSPPPDRPARETTAVGGDNPLSGAAVANVNPALAEEMGLSPMEKGVVVVHVNPGSIAAHLAFRAGDIIVKIDGRRMASVSDLKAALLRRSGQWRITVNRGGQLVSLIIGE